MHDGKTDPRDLYDSIIKEVEKTLIDETLKYTGDVKAKATKILGINRNTLSKKIKELGL
jgi:two-component system nitrogen regulation response regulator GlnG